MKQRNISSRLIVYRKTLNTLYHPLIILTQLFVAYFRDYISRFMHTGNGVPRAFVLFMRQLSVCIIFCIVMFVTGKNKMIRTRRVPFVITTALTQVFMGQHLFVKSQIYNGPLTCAIWQLLVPAIATGTAIYINFEPSSKSKLFGVFLCIFGALGRLVYNDMMERDENLFFEKYFLMIQVLFLSIGVLMQKKMIDKNNLSLVTLAFYVYLFAASISFINYVFMYVNFNYNPDVFIDTSEPYSNFLEWSYFLNIFDVLGIWTFFVISESFSYVVLMYFVKKASVSKASLFGALHALFVIVMKLIFDEFPFIDKLFMVCVVIAYIMIFSDKYHAGRSKKEKAQQVVFKRKLSVFSQTGEIVAQSKVQVKGKCKRRSFISRFFRFCEALILSVTRCRFLRVGNCKKQNPPDA